MHDRHSTFKIKDFYLYAVNTVSFTSFQWQHNGSTQRHGERLLCERKKILFELSTAALHTFGDRFLL